MKSLIVAALASGLLLSGCGTLGTVTPPADPAAPVSDVQRLTTRICGYVPTAQSIAALASTFFPSFGGASDLALRIASSVCDEIASRPMSEGPLVVRGVQVQGRFVRRGRR